jgi:prepilin-type N-terminal cleavage/methylation domain-containing protein
MNSKGFSLIEMTVVLALMGIASLGVLQITSSTMKATKTSEIGLEVNSIINSVTQNLLNSSACSNTFKTSGAFRNGLEIDEIKNRTDQVLFNKTAKYGNNRLKISKLRLDSVNIKPADPGVSKKYGEFRLMIEMEKLGTGYAGTKNVIKNIPLQGEFNLSDNLLKCYSSTEDAVYTAKKESCNDVGGTWDIATDNCNLSTSKGRGIAASTQDLSDQIQDLKDNYLTNNYVAKAGDTMTGDLTISGKDLTAKNVNSTADLKASGKVCVGTNCWDLAAKSCNKDSILIGIKADGTANCLPIKCNDGYYIEKLDPTSGDIVCKAIPTGTCPANTYVSQVKTDGTVTCSPLPEGLNQDCPTGQYMKGIGTDGTIKCSKFPAADIACVSGSYVEKYNSNGVPICKYTGSLKIREHSCETVTTSYTNTSGGGQYLTCPSGKFFKSLTFRANAAIDYVSSFYCCAVQLYYDPPIPNVSDPGINIVASANSNNGYDRYSDNREQANVCDNEAMHHISFGFEDYLEYIHNVGCDTLTMSPIPEGETKRIYVEGCTSPTTSYNSGSDNMSQSTNCSSDQFLMGVYIQFGGGGEYISKSKCCKINLR